MSNSATAGPFLGAASIALRFSDFEQYQQAVAMYCTALGKPAPAVLTTNEWSYSIPLDNGMELLCVWQSPPLQTDCTIVYWAVGTIPTEIAAASAALEAQGYEVQEAPGNTPYTHSDRADTQRAVLADGSCHCVGLIINPPIPMGGAQITSRDGFIIEPTHVINPPVTAE